MKVVMTGGGTGGHLYPALAVAEALKGAGRDLDILFVGSLRGIESTEVPEAGFAFRGLDVIGFPRRPGPRAIRAAWSFGRAVFEARRIVREYSPDVVFSTGGYASAPVAVGAWLEHVPLVLHEQNSVPGLTNRIACRMATEVYLAFASARRFFPKRRHLRLAGNPIRSQVTSGSRSRALRIFRLDEDRRTVLVFGGSQGARTINEAIGSALPEFRGREDLQFLIQSGENDYDQVLARCRGVDVKTWVRRFISNMGDAYALADLVVCRAGAMTVSELAACGLPSIMVPFPHAVANHQWLNGEQLREAGAAVLVKDADLTGAFLAKEINRLLGDRRSLRQMSINALRMARPEATQKIVEALLRYRPASETPPEAPAPVSSRERGRPWRKGTAGQTGRAPRNGGRMRAQKAAS